MLFRLVLLVNTKLLHCCNHLPTPWLQGIPVRRLQQVLIDIHASARMKTEAELIASELIGPSFAVRQAEEEMKFAQISSG